MVSDRPYRPALSEEEAVEELRQCKGTQFDPNVVDRFIEILESGIARPLLKTAAGR
jgi:HD-GYP domain-containing protein (c-di-GMP phosphodiesterase class II)